MGFILKNIINSWKVVFLCHSLIHCHVIQWIDFRSLKNPDFFEFSWTPRVCFTDHPPRIRHVFSATAIDSFSNQCGGLSITGARGRTFPHWTVLVKLPCGVVLLERLRDFSAPPSSLRGWSRGVKWKSVSSQIKVNGCLGCSCVMLITSSRSWKDIRGEAGKKKFLTFCFLLVSFWLLKLFAWHVFLLSYHKS